MRLLSIKAHGFKSFADKIDLSIGDGITCIVGPNGSGKSNIVDAVKWVLGENSLKELRGGDISSDVIFIGSKTRNPLTRAWVSLTFDNSDHYLDTDLDTVEIKREVFKTGENEYYINNTKVRKKDITDLFLDKGASAGSFSIISQGKIVEILKGRNIDRRQIVEEAAGVLKYKKRKEETTHKLENANDNLEKVNLVINELEVNLEPLRMQSEVAKKYIAARDSLKGIEVALLASDIKSLNDAEEEYKNKLRELNAEIMNLESSNTVDTTKLEELKTKSTKLDSEISTLSEEVMNLTNELSSLETKKQVISERKKYEVEDIKLENNIFALKESKIDKQKDLTLNTEELNTLRGNEDKLTDELAKVTSEYNNTVLKKNTLLKELSNCSKNELIIKNKIDSLNDMIENDTKLPYAVKSVLNNPRLQGIHDILGNLIETKEDYVTAIETLMGSNANVIVCDDEISAKNAINYLKDNKLGRATFYPISVINGRFIDDAALNTCKSVAGYINIASDLLSYNPLYHDIVLNQFGNAIVVNNIDTMNLLGKKLNYKYRIVTLDGEILHTGGSLTGGVQKNTSGILNAKYELERLNKELITCTNNIKSLELDINDNDSNLKVLEERILSKRIEITEASEHIKLLEQLINDLNNEIERIDSEITGTNNILNNDLDNELNKILEDYLKISTNKELKLQELDKLKLNKNDLNNEINELDSIYRSKNSEYNKKSNEIKDIEINLGKMDVKIDAALTRLSEEYEMTFEYALNNFSLDMDENVARNKVNLLKREMRDLGEVNLGSIEEYERINERYTFLTTQKSDIEGAIFDLNNIIADLDNEMTTKFSETFEKLNTEFKNVFKKLFKGGNAELILTEPDDMLNTGVDIIACPPGKSLKKLTTLSGGEMTLTAIALLFSVINIKPVPFCILDEVEAALDEANVDQFGTYIKEYENNSQFVVITHKKRTMEYANILYGITMQESGVSKIVSVKLENI